MKKILALALVLMMVLSLAACGEDSGKTPSGGGTSQQTPSGAAAQKADGEQMETDADNAHRYEDVISLSGLSAIGKPVGYTIRSTPSSTDGTIHGINFKPDSGSVSDTDLDGYAAAIWNLCMDVTDEGVLSDYSGKNYTNLAETKRTQDDISYYVWYYYLNGAKIKTTVKVEDNELTVEFYKK